MQFVDDLLAQVVLANTTDDDAPSAARLDELVGMDRDVQRCSTKDLLIAIDVKKSLTEADQRVAWSHHVQRVSKQGRKGQ